MNNDSKNDEAPHDARAFWVAAMIGFGATALVLTVVGATALVSRSSTSGPEGGGLVQSSAALTQATGPTSAFLSLSKPLVEVSGDVVATASVTPAGDTGKWTLQMLEESTWTDVATAQPDLQGIFTYTFQAPDAAGAYLYRVVLFDPQGAVSASSGTAELSVDRLPTQQVTVSWPKRPADYCASVGVPVEVSPAAARPVILQSSADGRTWVDAGAATTNGAGQARVDARPCEGDSEGDLGSLKWRVVAPETPAYVQQQSKTGTIRWCPAPSSVPFKAVTFNEFAPVTVDVTNPSAECAALVTIAAEFLCYQDALDAPVDPLVIGYRQSTPPMYVGPGETRNLNPLEIFTDSQRRCRDYYPLFDIYAMPETVEVWAESFTAP
jgi:hypothetical protein